MNKSEFDISSVRVAKPCHVAWNSMHGDDRVRRCGECELNIYNTAEMTRPEIVELIAKREDRLCIRLYRRADGTLLTKDCPVGLRAYRKRVGRMATAAVAAVLGLFSVSFGQKKAEKIDVVNASKIVAVKNKITQADVSTLQGMVVDPNGAVIPNAKIVLFLGDEKKEVAQVNSAEDGTFVFAELTEGTYRIETTAEHFRKMVVTNIQIGKNHATELNLQLSLNGTTEIVGIFFEEPMIDFTVTGPTPVKLTKEQIERIPGRRPF